MSPGGEGRYIEWAVREGPAAGQRDSGDRHLVLLAAGQALLAVVDGLGHGREACAAAADAVAVLRDWTGGPLEPLVATCHERLRGSRGVVMSLAAIEPVGGTLTWLGVGNVEGVLLRAGLAGRQARESLLLRGGVVGYQIPGRLAARTLSVAAGDLVALATDGITHGFINGLAAREPARVNADRAFAGHRNPADDALVLVATYRGLAS